MTYPPPAGSAAPPEHQSAPAFPAQVAPDGPPRPAAGSPAGGSAAPPPPAVPPARRSAFAEGFDRLRAAATTEPGRLRIIGAVLAALVVLFGALTAWQVSARSAAADDVVHRSQPLSADAAEIYRSLADANTTAATGFLEGGQEPRKVRERYDADIERASELLVRAAANSEGAGDAQEEIEQLNKALPVYTSLVETARANNRQGLPLGGAYLRYADEQMRDKLLPAARDLYRAETAQLEQDYADARGWPWAALVSGLLAVGVLGWAQHRHFRRTNRVFNHGMLAATAATAAVLLWLAVGHSLARSGLGDSDRHGAQSLHALNEARINTLKARADENLTYVNRGSVTNDEGVDTYEASYLTSMKELAGKNAGAEAAPAGSMLGRAMELADDDEGEKPVVEAMANVREWRQIHDEAQDKNVAGDYEAAKDMVIGGGGEESTSEFFDQVDDSLVAALKHEQREFTRAAEDGRGALSGLWIGAAVLGVLGAAGAVFGIGRRLSEYR
ncbi:hypothetical protein [Streptomyces sp. MAR4 CNX-425]|uniref:hypothetical protein n=1 Tax=Streptomyces sp. MAR4 CNX-425 TaxID=3406343 RepID=UPI003B50E2AD